MITDKDRESSQIAARALGLVPGFHVSYFLTNDAGTMVKPLIRGELMTVPGYYGHEGPYIRIRQQDHYAIDMVFADQIHAVGMPTDPALLRDWLDY